MGTIFPIDLVLLVAVLIYTVLVQALTEQTLKIFTGLDHKTWRGIPSPLLVALFWSTLLACNGRLNFFAIVGVHYLWAWLGILVTIVLMTGGSSLVHDTLHKSAEQVAVATELFSSFNSDPADKPATQMGSEQGISGVPPSDG